MAPRVHYWMDGTARSLLFPLSSERTFQDQQFVFHNGTGGTINDGTLSLRKDPHTCVDGMAGGGAQAVFTHMWTCYTDAADIGGSKAAAQTHQMWNYDTTTLQLKLTKAAKMRCVEVSVSIR
jgi:hypothetical protein